MKKYLEPEMTISDISVSDVINYEVDPDGEDIDWDANWDSLIGKN